MRSASELRRALKEVMPPESFEPQPWRGVAALAVFAANVGLMVLVVATDWPWFVDLPLALVIGEGMATVGLAAHEGEHGAMFRSPFAKGLLAWAGFGPVLVTPGLWAAWHVRAHHRGANQTEYDPDMLSDVEQHRTHFAHRFRTIMFPGSGHWLAYVGLFTLFTIEGQFFLWWASARPPLCDRIKMNRTGLKLSSIALISGWIGLGVALGPWNALCVQWIPLFVTNGVLMMYISTQHWLRPRVYGDDPFVTATSVIVPRWVDLLHYRFSHHQEHHIFPGMSPKFAPLLRAKLREIEPEAVAALPLRTAWITLFSTPTLYDGDRTLVGPGGRDPVDLDALAKRLHLPARF